MANNYKFTGVALATISETALLTAAADTTVVIKSIRVTNNTSNTPTISLDLSDDSASTEYTILKTQTLAANTGVELLSVPLVLEESDALKATMSATDSTHIGISYLVISWSNYLIYLPRALISLGVLSNLISQML